MGCGTTSDPFFKSTGEFIVVDFLPKAAQEGHKLCMDQLSIIFFIVSRVLKLKKIKPLRPL